MRTPLSPELYQATYAEAHRLHMAGDVKRARPLYENLADRHPLEPGPRMMLADLDLREGRIVTARERFEQVLKLTPDARNIRLAVAGLAEELGDMEAALGHYRRDAAETPDDPISQARLASVLRYAGKLDEAKVLFRRIVDRWPDASGGYVGLGSVDVFALTEGDIARMQALADQPGLPAIQRAQLLLTLGDLRDRQGRHDDAFTLFDRANRVRREHMRTKTNEQGIYEPHAPATVQEADAQLSTFVNGIRAMFTPPYLAHFAGGGIAADAPIFIVGMPRSGSTLLEQILSSHPSVTGLGETKALGACFRQLMPTSRAEMTPEFQRTFYRRVGEAYLDALKERGWNGQGRVIDKMLGNYAHIGIIHLALPNAIVIDSMRDPVDTCFSCFRQTFKDRNETTYDLTTVGRQYARYRDMMAYWDRVLPNRVLHVRHEDILADPDTQVRKLVADCGLTWHDACLRFHESDRPVRTASASQVRKPLFKPSGPRWKPYEKHLTPLFRALGPYAPDEWRSQAGQGGQVRVS